MTTIPGLPIKNDQLKSLFLYLNRPNPPRCTHTFKETREHLEALGLPVDPTLDWLMQNGAGCDCEVIFNTYDQWGEAVGCVFEDEDG